MRSTTRTAFAGLALVALCAGVAPSPAPSPLPQPSPSTMPTNVPAPSSAAPIAAPTGAPGPVPTGAPSAAPRTPGRPNSRASAAPGAAKASFQTPYYNVETDVISYKGNGDFTMPNKVTFSRPGSDGTADRAEGNDKRGTVSLIGNVVIHDNGNAPEAATEDEYAKGGPSTLTCDKLDVDSKAKIYVATGHVHFEQGDRKADSDHATLNRTAGTLHLEGHLTMLQGASTMRADDANYNLNTKRFEVTGKPVVIKQPVPTPEPGSVSPSPKPKKRRIPF
jgi:lipopolysaccharide export system protein LptA